MITKLFPYLDFEHLKSYCLAALSEHQTCDNQLSLTYPSSITDANHRRLIGIGGLSGKGVLEEDFDTLLPEFEGTPIASYRSWLIERGYKIGRLRLMVLQPRRAYSIHIDYSNRLHLAIKTNPMCFFVYPDSKTIHYIPDDQNVYYAQTMVPHTFVNTHSEERIHLVAGLWR